MLELITKHIVKPFKSFPYFGRFRFWCLYWAYRITGWHIRHKEWDFVLEYLPKLGSWQKVSILDVGCSRNLLCHELVYRGYKLTGIDLERPDFKYPGELVTGDIKDFSDGYIKYDFVTCISVLEHIIDNQSLALLSMLVNLKIDGRLILTIPTNEFAQGHPWSGFTYSMIRKMIYPYGKIIEYTEKAGQLCLVIARIS